MCGPSWKLFFTNFGSIRAEPSDGATHADSRPVQIFVSNEYKNRLDEYFGTIPGSRAYSWASSGRRAFSSSQTLRLPGVPSELSVSHDSIGRSRLSYLFAEQPRRLRDLIGRSRLSLPAADSSVWSGVPGHREQHLRDLIGRSRLSLPAADSAVQTGVSGYRERHLRDLIGRSRLSLPAVDSAVRSGVPGHREQHFRDSIGRSRLSLPPSTPRFDRVFPVTASNISAT